MRHGSNSGQPLTRARKAVLKVTGTATFAADNHPAGMAACGHGHGRHRARARQLAMDVAAARAHPGVSSR